MDVRLNKRGMQLASLETGHDAETRRHKFLVRGYAIIPLGSTMGILKGVRNSDEVLSELPMDSFCQDNNLDVDGNCLEPMSSVGNQPAYTYQIRMDSEGEAPECWHLFDTEGDHDDFHLDTRRGIDAYYSYTNIKLGCAVSYRFGLSNMTVAL